MRDDLGQLCPQLRQPLLFLLNHGRRRAIDKPGSAKLGVELGDRKQTDMLIAGINRIGDILENKRQAGLEEMLKQIKEDMEELKSERTRAPR